MKAITIWQPWASLIACGAKKYETRGWATNYRGPIVIHAAAISIPRVFKQIFPLGDWDYAPDYEAKRKLVNAIENAIPAPMKELPLGAVIATAELVGCWKISAGWRVGVGFPIIDQPNQWKGIGGNELLFGNYTEGRYAWELQNVKMLDEPIPAKGQQGLWNWNEKSYAE